MKRSKERNEGAIKACLGVLVSLILSFPWVCDINMKIESEYILSRVAKIAGRREIWLALSF